MAQAIIGLGNPGSEYRDTRHNLGQRVVDALARSLHARFGKATGHPVATARWRGDTVYLVKPQSYMNVSGPSVARLARRLHVGPADLIIVFDDIDLPLGTVRVRMKGSAGGHNGVRSIIEALGTSDIRRVKIGIGRPETPGRRREEVADHVLSPFTRDEIPIVEAACAEGEQAVLKLLGAAVSGPG
ncbi:MAG: aminoacyl-tRNA hydrolase [Candidatus Rokubacteria bacterium]|nr:aminoacyl-tRNA hydrolase [Candidatus Rokubacteria bacterium]